MIVTKRLLRDAGVTAADITHQNYSEIERIFEDKKEQYYEAALKNTEQALESLYGKKSNEITLQRLSASFRRGDLLKEFNEQK